jgi:hypothetical protein
MESQTIRVEITIIAEISSTGDRDPQDIVQELEQNSSYEIQAQMMLKWNIRSG